MKKLFLLMSLGIVAFTACKKDDTPTSSVSITSSDVANAGDTVLLNVDTTNLTGFSLGTPGQNVTWDFSALGVDKVDTVAFLIPSTTPGHTYFPTANMAIQPQAGQPIYMYLNKTTDNVEGIGMWANVQGTEVHADYTDKPIMIKFPMAYNSSYTDSAYLTTILNMQGTWIKTTMRQYFTSVVDASGTIKLPNNISFACIREKRTEIEYDTVYIGLSQSGPWTYQPSMIPATADTSYGYNFYAKNQKWSVASVSVDNFISNTINEISYKK